MDSQTPNAPEVYVDVREIPLAQPFSILISVCTEATVHEVRVDAIMPAHQHGLNYLPEVSALDEGMFRVDDLLFHMPGQWKLQADVDFSRRSVSYTSEITLK
ncbi:hypothetical protein RUESEDTHA_01579 [Ruegeria sp. THAF57]|uniref:hypothetical protein n=1 Tax=Ruegeria sp. THAF57 TaxID=2744555 RepID=UPI0015E02D72|nr:hypothetical protein [Ruegeria sp. THAF57]CAD0184697.1 hypothetical protein RUESEDTHA_01579 [Ruegeria sp. THAF57]